MTDKAEEFLRALCQQEENVRSVALLVDHEKGPPTILWTNRHGAITHTQDRHIVGMLGTCWKFITYLTELVGRYCQLQADRVENVNRHLDAVQQMALLNAESAQDGEKPKVHIPLQDQRPANDEEVSL